MAAFHKHKVELEKTGRKEFVLHRSLDNKLQTWQIYCLGNLDSGYLWGWELFERRQKDSRSCSFLRH